MNVILCGLMYSDIDNEIRKMKKAPAVAAHKYQHNIIKGLLENDINVSVVNIPAIRYYPIYPSMFCKYSDFMFEGKKLGSNIGFINIFGIRYVSQIIRFYIALKKTLKKHSNEKTILVCWQGYIANFLGMYFARRKSKNVFICTFMGDLFGKEYRNKAATFPGRYEGLRGKVISHIEDAQIALIKLSDCFCFLTPYMARALGVQDKPNSVIEGMYSEKIFSLHSAKKSNIKTIFYAGALEEEYGISHLLNAFQMIKESNYKLILAGNGGLVEKIISLSQIDKRIEYVGMLPPSEVQRYQSESTIMINPRKSDKEYVKYSFPSKTMDSLASGKPFVAHRLPCIPKEYDDYIQYADNETDEALRDKIIEICNMSTEERDNIGMMGRNFILKYKSPKEMCKRMIELWNGLPTQTSQKFLETGAM